LSEIQDELAHLSPDLLESRRKLFPEIPLPVEAEAGWKEMLKNNWWKALILGCLIIFVAVLSFIRK
jgi:hypothetical protein